MKSVLLGMTTAGLLAVAAFFVLEPNATSVDKAYATEGVRLSTGH